MIIILHPDTDIESAEGQAVIDFLDARPGVTPQVHCVTGTGRVLTEIYAVGDTDLLDPDEVASLPSVERVVRVSRDYRIIGRHANDDRTRGFDYNGIRFDQQSLHLFAGLCAVDNRDNAEIMMRTLKEHKLPCTRMGAFKPRTNPYSFQGHGAECLPWIFELAGKYDIKVIAMEVTHDNQVGEILNALDEAGHPTGVMLQIGTRNTQNFELLKAVGRQTELPILIKRGFGITLEESLNATEYLAREGNGNIIFCLRGMKTNLGDPHRNFVDFSHVPSVKHLTHLPVCIDPSHSVGTRAIAPDGILDIAHVTAQGITAGANMVLVDFHPNPEEALVDGAQALKLTELPQYLEDVTLAWETYKKRLQIWA